LHRHQLSPKESAIRADIAVPEFGTIGHQSENQSDYALGDIQLVMMMVINARSKRASCAYRECQA